MSRLGYIVVLGVGLAAAQMTTIYQSTSTTVPPTGPGCPATVTDTEFTGRCTYAPTPLLCDQYWCVHGEFTALSIYTCGAPTCSSGCPATVTATEFTGSCTYAPTPLICDEVWCDHGYLTESAYTCGAPTCSPTCSSNLQCPAGYSVVETPACAQPGPPTTTDCPWTHCQSTLGCTSTVTDTTSCLCSTITTPPGPTTTTTTTTSTPVPTGPSNSTTYSPPAPSSSSVTGVVIITTSTTVTWTGTVGPSSCPVSETCTAVVPTTTTPVTVSEGILSDRYGAAWTGVVLAAILGAVALL